MVKSYVVTIFAHTVLCDNIKKRYQTLIVNYVGTGLAGGLKTNEREFWGSRLDRPHLRKHFKAKNPLAARISGKITVARYNSVRAAWFPRRARVFIALK